MGVAFEQLSGKLRGGVGLHDGPGVLVLYDTMARYGSGGAWVDATALACVAKAQTGVEQQDQAEGQDDAG